MDFCYRFAWVLHGAPAGPEVGEGDLIGVRVDLRGPKPPGHWVGQTNTWVVCTRSASS